MSDLTSTYHPVSVFLEMLVKNKWILRCVGRSDPLRRLITIKRHPFWTVEIPASTLRIKTMQKTFPGRSTLGSVAVGIGEQDSIFCQCIQIRSFALRVSTHHPNPVIEIIHNNKDHIGFLLFLGKGYHAYEGEYHCLEDYILFIHGKERVWSR